jgi:hypothetical protein
VERQGRHDQSITRPELFAAIDPEDPEGVATAVSCVRVLNRKSKREPFTPGSLEQTLDLRGF